MSEESYIAVDLHIHTALSPCASAELTPLNVVLHAKKSGLDAIAITDHNSALNVKAAIEAGKEHQLTVIPGMEIETLEGVHVLALFEDLISLQKLNKIIEASLLDIPNNKELFGNQTVYSVKNEIMDEYPKLLAQSAQITLEKVVNKVLSLGGVPILSHIYRKANGILSVLGFIPPNLRISTLEVHKANYNFSNIEESLISHYNIIVNSDAHCIQDLYIEPFTALKVTDCSPKCILSKLKRKQDFDEVVVV